jgi:predicted amidophosphoribosyltransferase
VIPETVVLIDDIYTTGSTMEACTRVLKAAGVKKVYFLTICIGYG